MARKPRSSFNDQPDQLNFVERLTGGKRARSAADRISTESETPTPPVANAAAPCEEPSSLRRAMTSGISLTTEIVKDGAREAAVGGVREALSTIRIAIGTAVGSVGVGYFLLAGDPPRDEAKVPLPPSRLETGALPEKPALQLPLPIDAKAVPQAAPVGSPASAKPLKPGLPAANVGPLPEARSRSHFQRPQAPSARKRAEAKSGTRIFMLEDFVDWLKETPGL